MGDSGARYGEFDYETKPGARKGYYIGQENHFFETHRKKLYYFILLITIIIFLKPHVDYSFLVKWFDNPYMVIKSGY